MEKFVRLSKVFSWTQMNPWMTHMLPQTWRAICQPVLDTETGSIIGNQFLSITRNSKDLTTVELKQTLTDMVWLTPHNTIWRTWNSQLVFSLDQQMELLLQSTQNGPQNNSKIKSSSKRSTTWAICHSSPQKTWHTSQKMLWLFLIMPMEFVTNQLLTAHFKSETMLAWRLLPFCNDLFTLISYRTNNFTLWNK